jgi:hypothetical protein
MAFHFLVIAFSKLLRDLHISGTEDSLDFFFYSMHFRNFTCHVCCLISFIWQMLTFNGKWGMTTTFLFPMKHLEINRDGKIRL